MADELKRIEAIHGPYRGQQIDLSIKDAEQAIKDGWAKDPFAAAVDPAEQPEFDQDKHDKAVAAAEKAARQLRGEEEPAAAKSAAKAETIEAKRPAETTEAKRPTRTKE